MKRVFIREAQDEKLFCVIEKQKIGVAGMSSGAGVTLAATSLAKILSCIEERKVTLLEVCDCFNEKRTLIYDSIGFDKRFKAREFVRFYSEIKHGGSIRGKSNLDERINWGLITPEDIRDELEATPIELIRLINNISGDLIICDISGCRNTVDYLLDMDLVIFVIDPMPSFMLAGYPFMREVKRLEYNGKKVIWLINKFNSGINKRELQNFLKLKEYFKIPLITGDSFYSAEYNCKIPYEIAAISCVVKDVLEAIIRKEPELR